MTDRGVGGEGRPRCLSWSTDLAVLVAGGSSVTAGVGGELVVCTPDETTFWSGNLVLTPSVPADGAALVARFADALPAAAHVTVGFDDPAADPADAGWFVAHGFQVDRSVVLSATGLGDPGRRSGLTCRPLDGHGDWEQHAELARRASPSAPGVTAEFLLGRATTRRRLVEGGAAQWWGAFSPDGLLVAQLGVVACGDGRARYQSVETDPQWRRRGLATELLVRAAGAARSALGADELVIVADEGYWAITLYRALGFVDRESQLSAIRVPPPPPTP